MYIIKNAIYGYFMGYSYNLRDAKAVPMWSRDTCRLWDDIIDVLEIEIELSENHDLTIEYFPVK